MPSSQSHKFSPKKPLAKNSHRLAAIDVGTNSFHLIVASMDPQSGSFKVIDREKEMVRLGSLGSKSGGMKHLSPEAIFRALSVLKRFQMIAETFHAPIHAVATSAVREADNRKTFLHHVFKRTKIKIEVIPGEEEARLIYLGILQALPVFNKKILLVDIGGGSTEFLVGHRRRILQVASLKLGAVRLTDQFFQKSKFRPKAIKSCRSHISKLLLPVARAAQNQGFEIAIGSSGTILNLALMAHYLHSKDTPSSLNNFSFSREDLAEIVRRILKAKSERARLRVKGLDPKRADIIVAGALLLDEIFKAFDLTEMSVSEFALREGILLDTWEKKTRKKSSHHLDDLRYRNIIHLAENCRYDKNHAHHSAKLALRIFDQTKILHRLGEAEREYLEFAALLHEIGLFISHDRLHKHSYYLIRHSKLMGFTDDEKEIIALIARYHRKGLPKLNHPGFCSLSEEQRTTVTKLSAFLRIACGLDRTHQSVIEDVRCQRADRNETLLLHLKGAKRPSAMAIWGAERKKDLFELVFKKKLEFRT